MSDTLYTHVLRRAAEAEGGSAALASALHVPHGTLERWLSGRAQTPVRAFLRALELLSSHEKSGVSTPPAVNGQPLTFRMGQLLARCSRCDGTEFGPADPQAPLKLTSALACRACGEQMIHGNVIAQLAQDAVLHAHAMTTRRTRRVAAAAERRETRKDTEPKT
ncbi:MAG: hypothetical protein ABR570_00995 [Burkholderiales bacterium]